MRLNIFKHDRSRRIDASIPDLYQFIEDFTNQAILGAWYTWFEKHFGIPETVIKQFFKKELADQFDYVENRGFPKKLYARGVLSGALLYVVTMLRIAAHRQPKNEKTRTADLLLDQIEDNASLKYFERLINLFGRGNVVVLVPSTQLVQFHGVTVLNRPRFLNCRVTIREVLVVLSSTTLHIRYSIKVGVNLADIAGTFLDSFFYYRTIFEQVKAKHCLIYQHYQTDAVKNFLFKQSGGLDSSTTQKNILPLGLNGFYFDCDYFFSLGNLTGNRAFQLGARIDQVVPVGSLLFEAALGSGEMGEIRECWDVVDMGGNTFQPGKECDIYDAHNDDYLEHLNWLKRFSLDFPNLRIGFKHHPGFRYRFPPMEENILADSSVKYIEDDINSYRISFQSKVIVSWASTMVVELYGHGKPAFYLDPGGRNHQFIDKEMSCKGIQLTTYDRFRDTVLRNINNTQMLPHQDSLCLKSDMVSQRIYDHFLSFSTNDKSEI